jgi:hypothetical protein
MDEPITLVSHDASPLFYKMDFIEKCCRIEEPNQTDMLSVGSTVWVINGTTLTSCMVDLAARTHASFTFEFDSSTHTAGQPIIFRVEGGSLLPPKHSKICRNGKQYLELQLSEKCLRVVRRCNNIQIGTLNPISLLSSSVEAVTPPEATFEMTADHLAKIVKFTTPGQTVTLAHLGTNLQVDLQKESEILVPCSPAPNLQPTTVRVPATHLDVWRRPLPKSFEDMVRVGWTDSCFYVGLPGLETLFAV